MSEPLNYARPAARSRWWRNWGYLNPWRIVFWLVAMGLLGRYDGVAAMLLVPFAFYMGFCSGHDRARAEGHEDTIPKITLPP
jgi:hypothetical protein